MHAAGRGGIGRTRAGPGEPEGDGREGAGIARRCRRGAPEIQGKPAPEGLEELMDCSRRACISWAFGSERSRKCGEKRAPSTKGLCVMCCYTGEVVRSYLWVYRYVWYRLFTPPIHSGSGADPGTVSNSTAQMGSNDDSRGTGWYMHTNYEEGQVLAGRVIAAIGRHRSAEDLFNLVVYSHTV